MRRRLALVAFEEGAGPWTLTKGNECGVQVSGLGEDETLYLEAHYGSFEGTPIEYSNGESHVFPESSIRYRFVKEVPEDIAPSKTCVEVLLNG